MKQRPNRAPTSVNVPFPGELTERGERERAIEFRHRSLDIDPLNMVTRMNLSSDMMYTGRFKEAESLLDVGAEVSPGHSGIIRHYAELRLLQGRADEAAQFMAQVGEPGEDRYAARRKLILTAQIEHSLGHAGKSEAALDSFHERYGESDLMDMALIYAWRGEEDEAF